jgi:amino acid adenylation domain-containing protein
MVLVAAYQAFLHRYTGQEEILIGSPVSGRSESRFSDVVGCFVNSITLRGNLRGTPTSRAFLRQTRRTVLDALEHQDYPFRRLVEELRPTRDLERPSLFQTDFALHRPQRFRELATIFFADGQTRGTTIDLGGLAVESYDVHQQGGQLDLSVEMLETGSDVLGVFRYDPTLFDTSTIRRMIRHFQTLLDGMVSDPDTPISALPIMPGDERHTMLVEWNSTASPFPEHRCVHELFEEQAERTPDAVAMIDPGRALGDHREVSYRELNGLASAVASRLHEFGVGPDTRVGLCMGRSVEMIVGLLGILKAGAAYVPLDPAHPRERVRTVLHDAGVPVLLVSRSEEMRIPEFEGHVLFVDVDRTPDIPAPNTIATAVTPECLAYVMYTSGSSGRPKGVMIEHRGLVNYITAAAAEFGLTAADRVLQFASVAFDTAAEEIFPCLARGGTLVLRPEGTVPTIDEFVRMSNELGLTVWDLPTAYWHQLVDELERRTIVLPRSLRLVILGGERARPDRVDAWRARASADVRLLNTYGPTEATIVALSCDLTLGAPAARTGYAPIGRPVQNVRAFVLDSHEQPVPVGVVGELYLGGAGIARGYLNDPDQTAARFVLDPVREPGSSGLARDRLYRTGDLVRYLSDGNIDFVGRMDDQVKIRGVRVEVSEVEAALLQHPCVREAAVVAFDDDRSEPRLVAHIGGPLATMPAVSELREHLRPRLPAEMIPATFTFLETLPRTVSNKIDRLALARPDDDARDGGPPVAPRTATEHAIAAIYAPLLQRARIGVHDNFFECGGHSLTATRAITRIREAFGVDVQVRAIFDRPTVAEMAAHIDALVDGAREELVL